MGVTDLDVGIGTMRLDELWYSYNVLRYVNDSRVEVSPNEGKSQTVEKGLAGTIPAIG